MEKVEYRRKKGAGDTTLGTPFCDEICTKMLLEIILKVNTGSNEKLCLEATRMKTNSVPKLTKMLPPRKKLENICKIRSQSKINQWNIHTRKNDAKMMRV